MNIQSMNIWPFRLKHRKPYEKSRFLQHLAKLEFEPIAQSQLDETHEHVLASGILDRLENKGERPMANSVFMREIMPLFEGTREDFLSRARQVAIDIAERDPRRLCTVDMVREKCPPPANCDPRVMGAVFKCAGKDARWEKIGHVSSRRKACHGRPVSVFKLKPETVTKREVLHTMLAEELDGGK